MFGCQKWILAAVLVSAPTLASATDAWVTRGSAVINNQQVADNIARVLQARGQFNGCQIMIEFTRGTAKLGGTVLQPLQLAQAEQLARTVTGVVHVQNQLQISGGTATQVTVSNAIGTAQLHLTNNLAIQNGNAPNHIPAASSNYNTSSIAPSTNYNIASFPPYAWPSYASHPNYAQVTYPQQYSPRAWPFIGPFYPYPQVPLGWRKVTLEWDDGWWFLDFDD
ncbi:MAG: BON domain-containing protein [Planctomycetota bacterium]|jgi:hypothetical protein|nr:BON domain-containing protein [Planctomycetota bacterium]